jgi:hypothetical protein
VEEPIKQPNLKAKLIVPFYFFINGFFRQDLPPIVNYTPIPTVLVIELMIGQDHFHFKIRFIGIQWSLLEVVSLNNETILL